MGTPKGAKLFAQMTQALKAEREIKAELLEALKAAQESMMAHGVRGSLLYAKITEAVAKAEAE